MKKKPIVENPESESEPSPEHGPQLIVCIAAYNRAGSLRQAIASVQLVADRVVVVEGRFIDKRGDSIRSIDGTAEVAREMGAEVIQPQAAKSQPEQRDLYLLGKPNDWYLILDSDETLQGTFPKQDVLASHMSSYQLVIKGPPSWSPYPVPTIRLYRHIGEKPHHNPGQLLVDGFGRLQDATHPDGFGGILEACWIEHRRE